MVECNFDKSHCFCDGFVDHYYHRAVRRSENLGVPVVMWGLNLPHPPWLREGSLMCQKLGVHPQGRQACIRERRQTRQTRRRHVYLKLFVKFYLRKKAMETDRVTMLVEFHVYLTKYSDWTLFVNKKRSKIVLGSSNFLFYGTYVN